MKSRLWIIGLAAALLVGTMAAPAAAVSYTYTFSHCESDTICMTPSFGGTPDSVEWYVAGGLLWFADVTAPFDTCLPWIGINFDSLIMVAYYTPDPDSTFGRQIIEDSVIAIDDGRNCPENDSILIAVTMNDTTFGATIDSVRILNPGSNGPFNGTVVLVDSVHSFWYIPDPNYNGSDIFAYQIWICSDGFPSQTDTAVVAITIDSDGLLAFDSCWYQFVDVCATSCDEADSTISIGDSFRVCAHIPDWDLDQLTSGWPHVDLPGLAGSGLSMEQNPDLDSDSGLFCWPGFEADSALSWFVVTEGNLDVAAGFYEIITTARADVAPFDVSACTTIVAEPIDNNDPDIGGGTATWTLWVDVNGDGVATTVDTMRFFVDLRNEPFEEICQVCVETYNFPNEGDTYSAYPCLFEIAGDNRWALVFEVPGGDLENPDGPFTAKFRYTDNACNVDSVTATYNGPVDNTAPICANIETTYEALTDLDSNNCISLGETVRIEIFDTNSANTDVTYWLNLLGDTLYRFGLGVDDSTNLWHDSVPMVNLGGGVRRVDWTLGKYPLENAIDTSASAGSHPWVWLFAVDDAGNPFTCDSLQIIWTDPNPNIDELDARAPDPVLITDCYLDTTFIGTRANRIRFTNVDVDVAHFRMFYDNGTGVIDYVDTLAGLGWDDTLGGAGTDGLIRVDDTTWDWTTDGTVELSWCQDYLFNIWVIDSCGNLECLHPDSILCPGTRPDPVDSLTCSSEDNLNICLRWRGFDESADSFCIFMATNGAVDTAVLVATVPFVDTGTVYEWCTDDAGLDLIEFVWYDFVVITYDTCGNAQADSVFAEFDPEEEDWIAQCYADQGPPIMCVFQPEAGGSYSCENCELLDWDPNPTDGFHFYIQPCNDTSLDVVGLDTVLVRIADSAGVPGEWHAYGPGGFTSDVGPNHWEITIPCSALDNLVREDDTVEVLEVMVIAHDGAGQMTTRDEAEDCCGFFYFTWSAEPIEVEITFINGQVKSYQPYCDFHGWEPVEGTNTIEVCIEGGTPPYKIRLEADDAGWPALGNDVVLYVENVYAQCTTFTFFVDGFVKGEAEIDAIACDAFGFSDDDEAPLCVPDTLAPCGEISYPVDGKCIRRSRSMLDPVEVCVTVDPKGIEIDPDNVLKIDFQWARECCTGTIDTVVCGFYPCEGDSGSVIEGDSCVYDFVMGTLNCFDNGDGAAQLCTLFENSSGLDSIVCYTATTDTVCLIYDCRIQQIPCENVFEWETFAIEEGNSADGTDYFCVDWWNTDDLAWVTESGQIIWLRAIIYDEQGNTCTTPCVQVCVDIDTPPMCLWTPDVCYGDTVPSLSGEVDFIAELDFTQGNVDDIEDVTLWYKRSDRPDIHANWNSLGSGFLDGAGGTNSTVWRWDDLDVCEVLQMQTWYDFRLMVRTITGSYSWDLDGDGQFDAFTYDTVECDMESYFVDCMTGNIAWDTVWTEVNGETVVQPNVGCAMSDPRGWAWAQYGQTIEVQPQVWPASEAGSITKVEYSIWNGNCVSCDCNGESRSGYPASSFFGLEYQDKGNGNGQEIDCEHKVLAIREGANALDHVILDPTIAPFVQVTDGYQQHVLLVRAWDGCGNMTQDCIDLYLLDIDTTEAIIIEPMGDAVFCQDHDSLVTTGGCITLTAATLMNESFKQAIFYYRAVGSTEWIEIDSVEASGGGTSGDLSVVWCPHALGLPDGAYELTVVAEDYSLNRSEPGVYIVTVHLSCAAPTVVLTYPTPTDPEFMGCPIELEALATSPDPFNPIDSVVFYRQKVTSGSVYRTGHDAFSPNGYYHYYWEPPDKDGPYYIFARAWNRAGVMAESQKVWVKFDSTEPWAAIIQLDGDNNPNDDATPDIVAGDDVPIWAVARDRDGDFGYGEADNCGIDSLVLYIYNYDYGEVVFGGLMQPDSVVDSMYFFNWDSQTLFDQVDLGIIGQVSGEYYAWVEAYDCGCNSTSSQSWWFDVVMPEQEITLTLDGGVEICDTISIGGPDGEFEFCIHVPINEDINDVELWASWANGSDVEDQWFVMCEFDKGAKSGCFEVAYNPDGSADYCATFDQYGLYNAGLTKDGGYRIRATVDYSGGGGGYPGDFTFNEANPNEMLVRVDNTVAPFTASHWTTIKAGTELSITVDADPCDIGTICHELAIASLSPTESDEDEIDDFDSCLTSPFDPVDSGMVTLQHGFWQGWVITHVQDDLGNGCLATGCESDDHADTTELWILDMDTNQVRITSPAYDGYLIGDSGQIVARKLSAYPIDSVRFFWGTSQEGGTSNYIGTDHVEDGDEFSIWWQLPEQQGLKWIWATAYRGTSADTKPFRCPVTTAGAPDPFSLHVLGGQERVVLGQTLTFVGEHADLCLDRDSLSPIIDGIGIDSVVWWFRHCDAPGEWPDYDSDEEFDPRANWVHIGVDTYGSLCVDWFTDWCGVCEENLIIDGDDKVVYGDGYYPGYDLDCDGEILSDPDCCADGCYTLVAYVWDKAGQAYHSIPRNVMVDVTDPMTEVVDIDGDETFGTCHAVALPEDSVIRIMGVAIDDQSCEGSDERFNSGAYYLQFFAGNCEGGSQPVDIVLVVDNSNSMCDYYFYNAAIRSSIPELLNGLGDVSYRIGVLAFNGNVFSNDLNAYVAGRPIHHDGEYDDWGDDPDGWWTTSISEASLMVSGACDAPVGNVSGQFDNNLENGLEAMTQALDFYDFRSNARRVLILFTDEDADDASLYPQYGPGLLASGATIHTVMNLSSTSGYSTLAPNTGGAIYDINASMSATMSALATAITGSSLYNDVGIIWGKQVPLSDGQDDAFADWNITGLAPGEYCVWTVVVDAVGNTFTSESVTVCVEDHTPPLAYIAGFGRSSDEHMNQKYFIYAQSWDTDIDYVQFQYRYANQTQATDWVGIGVSSQVNGSNQCWQTQWDPCLLSGNLQLRVVATDTLGNVDHDAAPVAYVSLSQQQVQGHCIAEVTPIDPSTVGEDAMVWFEDRTFENLGLVNKMFSGDDNAYHHSMMAVWMDRSPDSQGDIAVEKIDLWTPDPDAQTHQMGSFEGSAGIMQGGDGWFWTAFTDGDNVTHLHREIMTVWHIDAPTGGCSGTHPTLNAKICFEPGSLSQDNGVVIFPARIPVPNRDQQHWQAWPAWEKNGRGLVTAIRFTQDFEGELNDGKYAKITIGHTADASLDPVADLTPAWWDQSEGEWNNRWDIVVCSEASQGEVPITATRATFCVEDLNGIYAVVSGTRVCNTGAITVDVKGDQTNYGYGSYTSPWPTIQTIVRSNIEGTNGNRDIDDDDIIVILDEGTSNETVLWSNDDNPDNGFYYSAWDNTTGILTTEWLHCPCINDNYLYDSYYDDCYDYYDNYGDGYYEAPPLSGGDHTITVRAFNRAGFCAEDTWTFTVDATPPDVEVMTEYVCRNPTFKIKITDDLLTANDGMGSGVDWTHVFVDVYDMTASEAFVTPKSRMIHTEVWDAFNDGEWNAATGEFEFSLTIHDAQYRRLGIVIYDGNRFQEYYDDCNCEYYIYDQLCDGVVDYVGNHQRVVKEMFTVSDAECGGEGGDGDVVISGGSTNPFDPYSGESISFDLNGFDGGGSVTVSVYDLSGRKVGTIYNSAIGNVSQTVSWSGGNDDGELVAEGVYLVHFQSTGSASHAASSQVLKVVVKRLSASND